MGISIDFNWSNFTDEGIMRVAFLAYTTTIGNYFWGIFFGFIGAGLYAKQRSLLTGMTYLILIGIFFSIVLPNMFAYLLGLILAFMFTVIFYNTFVKKTR